MHGGDIHEALVPFTIYADRGGAAVRETAEAMAVAYGIPRPVRSASVAGGSYAAAADLHAACVAAGRGTRTLALLRSARRHGPGGDAVGELRDVFGDLSETVEAPESGEVMFTAGSFTIGQDDPLLAVGAP